MCSATAVRIQAIWLGIAAAVAEKVLPRKEADALAKKMAQKRPYRN
jgi:hypothetical protein